MVRILWIALVGRLERQDASTGPHLFYDSQKSPKVKVFCFFRIEKGQVFDLPLEFVRSRRIGKTIVELQRRLGRRFAAPDRCPQEKRVLLALGLLFVQLPALAGLACTEFHQSLQMP